MPDNPRAQQRVSAPVFGDEADAAADRATVGVQPLKTPAEDVLGLVLPQGFDPLTSVRRCRE